jgi:hypothetical protein
MEYWDDTPFLPSLSVYEADDTPRDTGLITDKGEPIYSYNERPPVGFIIHLAADE